ncbi:S24 family peptidase [Sphingomonas pituitosa]|uniref:S24 family peptidase n=1 Tax=Sphingomonas pituitosa TaxID=99597 RepID=UPI0008336AAD|nr:S24 family peptidase [Sphingomonas pituitosa]
MADRSTILIDRIDERLQALGLSDRKASLAATGKPDLIRDIRRGAHPLATRLASLASILETTTDYLQGRSDQPAGAVQNEGGIRSLVPQPQDMIQDIPVYGTAMGSEHEYGDGFDGMVAIEQTDLNMGEVVDRFRRPPALLHRRDIYGLYVTGESMSPAFESGAGIIVDPKKPPSIRDYVVVYLRDRVDSDNAAGVLIKRLVRRSASYIELQQFNPPAIFRLDSRMYREVHRVMPWDEAFGM